MSGENTVSIEDVDQIDAIGIDRAGEVVLTISDHLPWADSADSHLVLLQDKINTYLAFAESGELLGSYPEFEGRCVVISIVGRFPLAEQACSFLAQAASVTEGAGVALRFQQFSRV
ncbi:MAG: DUF6572 domain-containing protein [Acidobacteriota bacterium]